MCNYSDYVWETSHVKGFEKGRAEGRAEGMAEGEEKKAHEMAKNLYALGVSMENIAQAAGCTVEKIRCWLNGLPA